MVDGPRTAAPREGSMTRAAPRRSWSRSAAASWRTRARVTTQRADLAIRSRPAGVAGVSRQPGPPAGNCWWSRWRQPGGRWRHRQLKIQILEVLTLDRPRDCRFGPLCPALLQQQLERNRERRRQPPDHQDGGQPRTAVNSGLTSAMFAARLASTPAASAPPRQPRQSATPAMCASATEITAVGLGDEQRRSPVSGGP